MTRILTLNFSGHQWVYIACDGLECRLEGNLLGYAIYLMMIFLPGMGFGELIQVWNDGENLASRFAWAFGIGLSFDTVVLLVRTSGLRLGNSALVGIDFATVEFILFAGLLALLVGLVLHRRLTFSTKVTRTDLLVGATILGLGVLLLSYFNKFPIFPEYQSPDYQVHVEIARALLSGTATSIPSGVLYYAVHFQLASAILLVGGEPLIVVQRTMAILVVLSPLFIYQVSVKLFENQFAALLNVAIYAFSGTIWFGSVFNSGLYANFFGILIALFLLTNLVNVTRPNAPRSTWVVFLLSTVVAYMSHYTEVTVFAAILLTLLVQLALHWKEVRPLLAPSIVIAAPSAVVVAVYPRVIGQLLASATQGGGSLIGSTTLSTLLSPLPVLGFLALEITDDVATIVLLALAVIFIYDALKTKKSTRFYLPLIWLLALIVVAPFNAGAWRFSYEALVPLTVLSGFAIYSVLPKQDATVKRQAFRRGGSRWKARFFVLIPVILLLAGSWGQRTIENVIDSPDVSSQAQQQVYSSIYWLRDNTPQNSAYLSVSDWRFTYSGFLIGRNTIHNFISQPEEAAKFAKGNGLSYIIVTNLVTESLPPVPQLFPWNNFPSTGTVNLTLVYSGTDVRIYKVH